MDGIRIFVVDDDRTIRATLTRWLEREGCQVTAFAGAAPALHALEREAPETVCLDISLASETDGLDALETLQSRAPELPVLMITGHNDPKTIVNAMKLGAYDYMVKPVDRIRFLTSVRRAVNQYSLMNKLHQLEDRLQEDHTYHGMVGKSAAMRQVFQQIERVRRGNVSVHVHGESGTGKELVARAIHRTSNYREGPFVAINCGAVPEGLMEDELFGHERGSYTGALNQRKGKVEEADRGALFLDEVAEMPEQLQVKFLRLLQEREFERLGGNQKIKVDLRIISATNKNLETEVAEGRFREDLYYRLVVYNIDLPPLREHTEDIPLLISHFLNKYQRDILSPVRGISPEAMDLLTGYQWPGNIRELENAVCRLMLAAEGTLADTRALPAKIRERQPEREQDAPPATAASAVPQPQGPPRPLRELEELAVRHALAYTNGGITAAASLLGIGRATLYRKLKKYEIQHNQT